MQSQKSSKQLKQSKQKNKPILIFNTVHHDIEEARDLSGKQQFASTDSDSEESKEKETQGFKIITVNSDYSGGEESVHSVISPGDENIDPVDEENTRSANLPKEVEMSEDSDYYLSFSALPDKLPENKEPNLIQLANQQLKQLVAASAPWYLASPFSPVKDWKVATTVFVATAIAERVYFDLVNKEEPFAYYQQAAEELSLNRVIVRNVIKTILAIGGSIVLGYQLSFSADKIPEWLAGNNTFFKILGAALQEPYFVLTLGTVAYLQYKASWKGIDNLFYKCCSIPVEKEKFAPQNLSLKQYAGQQFGRGVIVLSMLMMVQHLSQADLDYLSHVKLLIACDTLWKLMTLIEQPDPIEALAFNVSKQMIKEGYENVDLRPATTCEKIIGVGRELMEHIMLAFTIYGTAGLAAGMNEDLRESNDINDHLPWLSLALTVSLSGGFVYQHREKIREKIHDTVAAGVSYISTGVTKVSNVVSSFFHRGSAQPKIEEEPILRKSPVLPTKR